MYELSDSEDDCYDFTQKLKKLRSQHALNNRLKLVNNTDDQPAVTNIIENKDDSDIILVTDSNINDNLTNTFASESNIPPEGVTTRSRRNKRTNSDELYSPPLEVGRKRGRGKRGRGRGRGNQSSASTPPLTRGTGRRGRTEAAQSMIQINSLLEAFLNPTLRASRSRGTPRARGRGRRRGTSRSPRNSSIIYSIGNTDEYPDGSDGLELFSTKNNTSDTNIIDLDESLNNEELSVKVYWQNSEVFKFNIRRLQKLTQIFDFFVDKKGVSRDQLLFTYNYKNKNRILHPDDSPDSIDYNIAKFIEGGIVNEQFTLNTKSTPKKKGFVIKFQCQNRKKPVELAINKDEKLQIAMVKCAEHLELPITDLVFKFDGETILGNVTPSDLDMESGDCVDVKITNVIK